MNTNNEHNFEKKQYQGVFHATIQLFLYKVEYNTIQCP